MANKVNDLALVATLSNNKKVLLEPNYTQEKCFFRYLTGQEMLLNKLDVRLKANWLEAPIYSTTEQGVVIIFCVIEGTTVVLNRI